jgi:hypothetical protein
MTYEFDQKTCWAAQKYLDLWLHDSKMVPVASQHGCNIIVVSNIK